MKKHFNINLIMTEEEEQLQSSNISLICEKLIEDEKIRVHCHITGKFRVAAQWSCNINLQLTKKVPVIFHSLRGYDSHLIFNELKKIDVKIDVIPNRLEKYIAFMINKNLVFVSDEGYLPCNKIWNNFNMENMGDYRDHYLKKDVLLLADVFEKFISTCLRFYKLDPCHYFSSPGLSWDAMLKLTGIELEKISDIDMYLFIEKGLRGGISYISKRYSEANNKYMKNYDSTKLSKCIKYLDKNNLYG